MTKKHFEAIAEIISKQKPHGYLNMPITDCAFNNAKKDIAKGLADYFEQENPNFDRSRFIVACIGNN